MAVNPRTQDPNVDTKSVVQLYIDTKDDRYFKVLYDRLYKGLYHHIFKFVKDDDVTRDVLSDTFCSILQNFSQYDPARGAFSTWAYNIAKNAALHWIHQENRQETLRQQGSSKLYTVSGILAVDSQPEDLEPQSGYIDSHVDESNNSKNSSKEELFVTLHQRAVQEIMNLSDVYRQCMYEREILGLPYDEIAERNSLKINTVKSKIRLGREIVKFKILEYLESIGIDPDSMADFARLRAPQPLNISSEGEDL